MTTEENSSIATEDVSSAATEEIPSVATETISSQSSPFLWLNMWTQFIVSFSFVWTFLLLIYDSLCRHALSHFLKGGVRLMLGYSRGERSEANGVRGELQSKVWGCALGFLQNPDLVDFLVPRFPKIRY